MREMNHRRHLAAAGDLLEAEGETPESEGAPDTTE